MGTDSTLSAMLVVTGIAYAARWPMAAREPEQLAENLYNRLRAVTEQLDQIRDEAADLAADLRNRLNALMLQRRAVERLDGNRQARIEQQSEAGNRSDQRRGPAASAIESAAVARRYQPVGRSTAALQASEQNS
jgi:hypothetical protein